MAELHPPAEFTFTPLTPAAFLDRAAAVFGDRTAVIDGGVRFTYTEFAARVGRLRTGLMSAAHESSHDPFTVVALCTNSHTMLELHHAAPAAGAVLVALNIRLAEAELMSIVSHSDADLLVATHEFSEMARAIAARTGIPLVMAGGSDDTYEAWLEAHAGTPAEVLLDERQLLAINYTSGTTGAPKGVMYHHRGAYMQAVAMAYHAGLGPGSRYLWTLPMFHCNGWCFTWAVTAAGGTHVCLRSLDPESVWKLIRSEGVTHLGAAPTVLGMLAASPEARPISDRALRVDTGGSPPSPALLGRLEPLGFQVTHLYGLTETYGPIAVNVWQPEWDTLEPQVRARLRARQGVPNLVARPLRVLAEDGHDVPADGLTLGEIAVAGNDLMLGYYKDAEATAAVTRSGCFLTGDLAVKHPDGYVEIRDRSKDVIISGGENIASVEVEQVICEYPGVLECAVVAAPDEKWGEVPIAFVTVMHGEHIDVDELLAFVRQRLAGFKVPKGVHLVDLPRTSTGKIQKHLLRSQLN